MRYHTKILITVVALMFPIILFWIDVALHGPLSRKVDDVYIDYISPFPWLYIPIILLLIFLWRRKNSAKTMKEDK